jgi:hypothetical protein
MQFLVRSLAMTAAALASGFAGSAAAAESLIYSPYPYAQRTDGPWNLVSFDWFELENFEGDAKPGYTATTGGRILGASLLTDSVDADDGVIDGLGTGGRSWFSDGTTDTITFTFDAAVLGRLPTHVGIVWTDVGNPGPGGGEFGRALIFFEAFDAGGNSIGGIGRELGDSAVDGGTDEDSFAGVYHPGGVSSIRMTAGGSLDWEVDHLQYGFANAIPEPEQWLLMALGLGALAWRLRKARAVGR